MIIKHNYEKNFLKNLCKLFCSDYLYEPQFFSVYEFYRIARNYVNQLEIAESRKPAIDWRVPYLGVSEIGIRFLESCHPQRFVRGSQMNHEDYLAAFYPAFLEQFPAMRGFSNLHQWLKSGKVEVNSTMLDYQRDSRHCQLWRERNNLLCDEAEQQYHLPFMTLSDVLPFLEMCRQEGFVLDDVWGYAEDPEDMDGRLSRVELFSAEEFAEYRQLFRCDHIVEQTNDYLMKYFSTDLERFRKNGQNYFEQFYCSAISRK